MTTNRTGNIAEIEAIAKLTRLGYTCSIPFGNACRYDLIADKGGQLNRVQVKSGRTIKNKFTFNNYTTCHGKDNRYTAEDIDLFFVYVHEVGRSYLIPIADCIVKAPRFLLDNSREV